MVNYSAAKLKDMKIDQLKDIARSLKKQGVDIKISGTKSELIKRISSASKSKSISKKCSAGQVKCNKCGNCVNIPTSKSRVTRSHIFVSSKIDPQIMKLIRRRLKLNLQIVKTRDIKTKSADARLKKLYKEYVETGEKLEKMGLSKYRYNKLVNEEAKIYRRKQRNSKNKV